MILHVTCYGKILHSVNKQLNDKIWNIHISINNFKCITLLFACFHNSFYDGCATHVIDAWTWLCPPLLVLGIIEVFDHRSVPGSWFLQHQWAVRCDHGEERPQTWQPPTLILHCKYSQHYFWTLKRDTSYIMMTQLNLNMLLLLAIVHMCLFLLFISMIVWDHMRSHEMASIPKWSVVTNAPSWKIYPMVVFSANLYWIIYRAFLSNFS